MKGIVLAGGRGMRLYPLTIALSKHLLPIYNKPMIYYAISTLMLSNIRDILIISAPDQMENFHKLLGDGAQWGLKFSYAVQEEPRGIADALLVGRTFLDGSSCALILGDNIFYGHDLGNRLLRSSTEDGATIFAYRVSDPSRYGIVNFDAQGVPLELSEKPANPQSSWAVTGLYFYGEDASERASRLRPSARGELEITDLNSIYLREGRLKVERLSRGYAWFDAGTYDSLLEASLYVQTIEKRQGLRICAPEEIALSKNWISIEDFLQHKHNMAGNEYLAYRPLDFDSF